MIDLVDAVSVLLVVGTVGAMYLLQTLHESISGWANACTGESKRANPLTPIPTCQVVCGVPEE